MWTWLIGIESEIRKAWRAAAVDSDLLERCQRLHTPEERSPEHLNALFRLITAEKEQVDEAGLPYVGGPLKLPHQSHAQRILRHLIASEAVTGLRNTDGHLDMFDVARSKLCGVQRRPGSEAPGELDCQLALMRVHALELPLARERAEGEGVFGRVEDFHCFESACFGGPEDGDVEGSRFRAFVAVESVAGTEEPERRED